MEEFGTIKSIPEKMMPFIRKADREQRKTLYRLAHHLIRGQVPKEEDAQAGEIIRLVAEGSERQQLLMLQAAYHLARKNREL